jgi:hypothetical protein
LVEESRFDLVARLIADAKSRRATLQGLAGAISGLALIGLGGEDLEAKKKKKKKKKNKNKEKCKNSQKKCQGKCIPKDDCCTNDDCEGDELCDSGQCVPPCPTGEKLCNGECIAEEDPCFQTVTSSNLQGWLLEGEDPFSQNPQLTQIVDGPEVPPQGVGSVQLKPTAFDGFPIEGTQAVLRTLQYAGTPIASIDQLSYSIYVPEGGDPPTMQLAVLGANSDDVLGTGFASFVFVPGGNGNEAPLEDTWINYTPSEEGLWASTRNIFGPGDECVLCRFNGAPTGSCAEPGACTGKTAATWQQIVDANPDAVLNGEDPGNGGFSFRIGRGDTGQGNVTNIVFDDDGYIFEAEED